MKLSRKLIDNAPGFIALEVVIVLIAVFAPLFTLDLSVVGETAIHVSLGDIITEEAAVAALGLPGIFILGLVGMSVLTTFFGKAKKSDVDSAMPFLAFGIIGTIMIAVFVVFMSHAGLFNGLGIPAGNHAALKEYFKIGGGSGMVIVLSLAGSGLAVYTYLEEKK